MTNTARWWAILHSTYCNATCARMAPLAGMLDRKTVKKAVELTHIGTWGFEPRTFCIPKWRWHHLSNIPTLCSCGRWCAPSRSLVYLLQMAGLLSEQDQRQHWGYYLQTQTGRKTADLNSVYSIWTPYKLFFNADVISKHQLGMGSHMKFWSHPVLFLLHSGCGICLCGWIKMQISRRF